MEPLTVVVAGEVAVFIGGLALLIVWRLLTGGINIVGLLSEKLPRRSGAVGRGDFSPARLQLLLATLVGATTWSLGFATSGGQLPDVPRDLLLLLGGSHALYLGSKSGAHLFETSLKD